MKHSFQHYRSVNHYTMAHDKRFSQ